MLKKHLLLFAFLFTSLFSPKFVVASDKDVICTSFGCSGFEGNLFNEPDLKPGDTYEKSFCIRNELDEDLSAFLSANDDPGNDNTFEKILEIEIKNDNGDILFNGSLEDFLGKETALGDINKDETECYQISVYFPSDAGNVYQENQIVFDLVLRITGEETGTTQVLSSQTSSCESCETSTDVKSILGEVLGLSDTGGFFVNLFYFTSGLFLIILGLKYIRKYFTIRCS